MGDGNVGEEASSFSIDTPELAIRTTVNGERVTVTMSGSAEGSAIAEVGALVKRLHDRVARERCSEVVLDVRALSFMTASCFEAFVSWVDRLQALSADARYRIRFVYDERKYWQSRSLGALATLGAGIVHLDNAR